VASSDENRTQEKVCDEVHGQGATRGISLMDVPKDQPKERRSDRLLKDIIMTTQEKTNLMAKKRNLKGNTTSTSTFSNLHHDLHVISKKMGVVVENENSNSFDILKEIETARMNLFNKQ